MAVLVDHVCPLIIRHELHKPLIEVYFPKHHISKGGGRMILLPEDLRSRDYIERDRWDFLQEATLSDCVVQD